MNVRDLRAKYNAGGNAIIPNSFQCPNFYVDILMYYLTPEESVVLFFAIRRILGFQANILSRKDKISLSQFTNGLVSKKDKELLSHGCGLGIQAVRNALETLAHYKILIPTTDKASNDGQEYWLQDDENVIDLIGLEERLSKNRMARQARTQKATAISLSKRGVTSDVTPKKSRGVTSDVTPGVTSDVTPGVTSDVNTKPIETQGNPPLSGQIEKTIQMANREVDAILAQMQMSAGKSWTNLPEPFHPYGKAFCAATGLKYVKKALYDWIGEFETWEAQGYTPADVIQAVQEIADLGKAGTISSPRSITWKLNGIKAARTIRERTAQKLQDVPQPDWMGEWERRMEQANA